MIETWGWGQRSLADWPTHLKGEVYNSKSTWYLSLTPKHSPATQDKQLSQFKKRFSRVNLITLDEMGYVPFTKNGSELLFQLISDLYEKKHYHHIQPWIY